jgi:hypothetical protein
MFANRVLLAAVFGAVTVAPVWAGDPKPMTPPTPPPGRAQELPRPDGVVQKELREAQKRMEKLAIEKPGRKVSTVIPLAILDPRDAVAALTKICGPAGPVGTILPLPDESGLLVYADPEKTLEIRHILRLLGEPEKKKWPSVIPISNLVDLEEVVKSVEKKLPAGSVLEPLPKEHALLVYATDEKLKEIREILRLLSAEKPAPPVAPKTFPFSFKEAKWDEVLDVYSKHSGLTLITTVKPTGKFTFTPPAGKEYTVEEMTDIINEALVPQKRILIRRHLTFFIHPTDERVDGMLARTELADLEWLDKGNYVSVVIPLAKVKGDEIFPEVKLLLGPLGSILPSEQWLLVQDTVGNLRQIVMVIRTAEKKAAERAQPELPKKFPIQFKKTKWEDVLDWYAKLTGLKAEVKVKPKGSLTCVPRADRQFTLNDITDLLNEALEQHKLLLIPTRNSFAVVSVEEKIDPKLIPTVELKDLANLPRSALVEVAIPFGSDLPLDDLVDELKKLLTPFGEILYAKGNWLILRDTVVNIQRIRSTCSDCAAPHLLPPHGRGARREAPQPAPKTFPFSMKDAAWDDVFAAYAKLTGLQAVVNSKPKGTFTFVPSDPDREFTLAEITDIINDALLAKNHLLIRRHMTFVVVPADKKVDPVLVPRIALHELPGRGRTELVEVIIPLRSVNEIDASEEAKKLLGQFGSASALRNGVLIVTDTAGNVAKIKKRVDELAAEEPGKK